MAGYFSNHSNQQSRFLANSSSSTTTSVATPQPTSMAPRAASSKQFSTSLSALGDEKPPTVNETKKSAQFGASSNGSSTEVHPLRNTWVFWFRQQRGPGTKITNYEEGIKRVAAFGSVESFWSLWSHLHSPSQLMPTTDFLLFHSGVKRPVWEDPLNLSGGKWIVRLRKGVADRIWENIVLGIIGDQFMDCQSESGVIVKAATEDVQGAWPEICGVTLSVRQSEDILSVWNRSDGDLKQRDKIRDVIRQVLDLPQATIMEYKSNNDSMQDKSSFRNSAIDRTPLS